MEQTRQCGQVIELFVEHQEGFGFDNVQQGLRRIVKLVKGKPKLVSALRYAGCFQMNAPRKGAI